MKKKLVRCILIYLMLCSMVIICTACNSGKDETERNNKKETESVDKTEWSRSNHLSTEEKESYIASLKASDNLVPASAKVVAKISLPDEMTAMQGGYTNGKHYFQGFIQKDTASNEMNNVDRIVRFNMDTEEVEIESEDLALNHCNDITYNEKLGYLVVCHNNPCKNSISYINPEDMSLVKTFPIDYYIWSIDYNPRTDRYVVGISGGQKFRLLDSEFNAVGDEFQPSSATSSSITQGVAADDDFIYFVYYLPNVMGVYDWDGNFVTKITLNQISTLYEPENVSVIGNTIYVGCSQRFTRELVIFKLNDFVPNTESSESN